MSATSKHYSDVQKWIEQVIESCETHRQLNNVEKLIDNFSQYLINYVNPDYSYDLTHKLRVSVYLKSREIKKL